jgi:colicin import membrane protein
MASIKQLIINAIIKVSAEDPAFDREGGPTAEEARDSFIALLMAELFPEHGTESAVEVPVVVAPVASPAKKLTKEEKEAAKAEKEAAKAAKEAEKAAAAKAKEEAKAAKEAEKAAKAEAKAAKAASPKKSPEEKEAEKAAKAAEKEAAKAAAAKVKEEAKAAEKAEKEAAKAAEKAAKAAEKEAAKAAKASPKPVDVPLPASPAPKPKKAKAEKPADGSNLQKIDPTWRKALKEADKENAKELEPELLTYLNALSNVGFNSRTAREHVAAFLAERTRPTSESTAQVAPVDLEVVEFEGKEYYVNPETKRVYEGVVNEEGELTITKPVGYVGMADFKDMVLEEE